MKAMKSKITHDVSGWGQNRSHRLALDHVCDSWQKQYEHQADTRSKILCVNSECGKSELNLLAHLLRVHVCSASAASELKESFQCCGSSSGWHWWALLDRLSASMEAGFTLPAWSRVTIYPLVCVTTGLRIDAAADQLFKWKRFPTGANWLATTLTSVLTSTLFHSDGWN